MAEINWSLIAHPVDTAALTQQGFATGMAMVKQVQTRNALRHYLANPDDEKAYSALAFYSPEAAASIQRQQMLRRKEALDLEDTQRRKAVGALAATGDLSGASAKALQGGDTELAAQIAQIGDADLKKSAEFWKTAGPLAFRLKEIKDPAARRQLYEGSLPILQASGADAKTIAGFDPTNDAQLDAAITTAQTIAQQIDQRRIHWEQQGANPSIPTDAYGNRLDIPQPGTATPGAEHPAASSPPAQAVGAVATTLAQGGLPDHVVAGFLGNFDVEGGYSGAQGDGGASKGIAQWNGERATNFKRVIGKEPTQAAPDEQAKFVLWEMQNPEAAGMTPSQRDAILGSKSASEAAMLIDHYYERSSGGHRPLRVAAAERYAQGAPAVHRPKSKTDFDALPTGAEFIAPDGSVRRKP